MGRKLFVLVSVLLVLVSLNCSMVAYAQSTTSVYVITKIEPISPPHGWKYNYFYTNNGLVKKCISSSRWSASEKYTEANRRQFTYDTSGNLLEEYSKSERLTYSYDKKGKVKKYTSSLFQVVGGYDGKTSFSGKPKYNANGLVTSIPHYDYDTKVIFQYNENGLPIEVTKIYKQSNGRYTDHYQYDAMGNVVETYCTANGVDGDFKKYKYTYENGRVSKLDLDSYYPSSTMYYSYKQITIPKKLKAKVQKQQWKIINRDAGDYFSIERPW